MVPQQTKKKYVHLVIVLFSIGTYSLFQSIEMTTTLTTAATVRSSTRNNGSNVDAQPQRVEKKQADDEDTVGDDDAVDDHADSRRDANNRRSTEDPYSSSFKRDRKPVLSFGVGNGLHNQVMSFVDGMVVALLFKEQYDVVLPTFWGSMGIGHENRSQPMEFGELYDADYFIECLSESTSGNSPHRQIIYQQLPSNAKVRPMRYPAKLAGRKINDKTNSNWNITQQAFNENTVQEEAGATLIVDIGRFFAKWNYEKSDITSLESRQRVIQCIKPSAAIQEVVIKAMESISNRYGHSQRQITAIHPRLEEDWRIHCNTHGTHLSDCWINEKSWIKRLLKYHFNSSEIPSATRTTPTAKNTTSTTTSITSAATSGASAANTTTNNKSQNVLLLLGGKRFNKTIFEKKNLTVITKHDLVSQEVLSNFQYTSSFAAIDFFLALEVDSFIGHMRSSMDIMIFESRVYKFMSLDKSESIHYQFGQRWLATIGVWTKSSFFFNLKDVTCHYVSNHISTTYSKMNTTEVCDDSNINDFDNDENTQRHHHENKKQLWKTKMKKSTKTI